MIIFRSGPPVPLFPSVDRLTQLRLVRNWLQSHAVYMDSVRLLMVMTMMVVVVVMVVVMDGDDDGPFPWKLW